MTALPLFPLGTVLMPGAVLPLVVFEDRYVAMLHDLLVAPAAGPGGPGGGPGGTQAASATNPAQPAPSQAAVHGSARFGVVALRRGHEVGADQAVDLHEIGCVATIEALQLLPGPGGPRYQVIARGGQRFRLHEVRDVGTPYLVGTVTLLDDGRSTDPDPGAEAELTGLTQRVRAAATAYGQTVGLTDSDLPPESHRLAYAAAERAVLDLDTRQAILAAPDTVTRLRRVLDALRRESVLLGQLRAVPRPPTPSPPSPN